MNDNISYEFGLTQQQSLIFNGKVTASVSHDIKNVMAIINENAGLLQDISAMMEEGFVLSPHRLDGIAKKIEIQISRANEIIYRLNRFAHSVDEDIVEFDIYEVTEYMLKIYERIAKSKAMKINLIKPCKNYKIKTNLFNFEYLIWYCLDLILKNIIKETNLEITINFENQVYNVIFNLNDKVLDEQSFNLFVKKVSRILESFQGNLILGLDGKNFILQINI